jgi:hypothetical protein
VQDGHSNEEDSISEAHCDLYDRLHHNNSSELQTIDTSGTIGGCWLYETESDEKFYWNDHNNPSGMCSSPHFCIQYIDCAAIDEGIEVLLAAPTASPTTSTPTSISNIGTAEKDELATKAPTRSDPALPTHNILVIATIALISILAIMGYLGSQTHFRGDVTYRTTV